MLRLTIGSWTVDEARDSLERGAEQVKLERRTMATLLYLAQRPNAVVSREELLEAIWPNVFVSDHSVATVISDLRRALGDPSKEPQYIETIAKRGYRLIAPVQRLDENIAALRAVSDKGGWIRQKLAAAAIVAVIVVSIVWMTLGQDGHAATGGTIVVREFENASGRHELDHIPFAIGDIVASTLAAASHAPVIRSPSGANSVGDVPDPDTRTVSGRILSEGDNLVALIQVTNAATREVIWTESYVVAPGRLASRSREVARDVTAALGLSAPEMLQSAHIGAQAYERYWRARFLWDKRDGDSIKSARQMLEDLTRDEPRFAAAHAALADIYAHKSGEELGIPRVDTFSEAQSLLDRANALAPNTSDSLVTQSVISFYRDRNLVAARQAADRAIDRDSDNPRAWQTLAMVESAAGNRTASIAAITRASKLDPGSGSIAWDQAWHLILARRYREAAGASQRVRRLGQSASMLTALIENAAGNEDAAFKAWLVRAAEGGVPVMELATIAKARQDVRYRLLARAFSRAATPPRHVIAALLLVEAGDKEAAAGELRAAREGRHDWMTAWAPHMRELEPLASSDQQRSRESTKT